MKPGWQTIKLRNVCELVNGRAYSKPELLSAGNHRVLRVGNFFTNDSWYYSDLELEENKYCDDGDLLYAWSASFGPRIWNGGKVIYHYHIWKVLPNPSLVDKKFLYYFLLWDAESAKEQSGTGTTMTHVSMGSMKERLIPITSLLEQKRIVAILDKAFAAIATAKANTEKNLLNARGLFDAWLQSLFSIDHRWERRPLGELAERITKGSSPRWQGIKYVDEPGIRFITSEDVGEFQLLPVEPKYVEERFNLKDKKSILMKGDVLTNIVGASIGRTAVFHLDEVCNINQAVCLIRCKPSLLSNAFLASVLNSPLLKQTLHDNEVNTARANLSLSFFARLPIPLPPLKTQKQIAEEVSSFRQHIGILKSVQDRKVAGLEELKKSLLDQAFSGSL